MKKILSLLSMLMVTVMAFATDYTDQLTFTLTLGSSYDKALPEGTLTVEKRVDGTYNVTACGCDFSTNGFGNWGDISCDAVEGTTDTDGLTTIQVSNPEVFANGTIVDGFSLKGESLLVKFNGTKAYALFKGKLALNAVTGYPFEYTFGTDEGFESTGGGSTGGGETGGEVTEKYTVNFDKTAYHSRNDRVLSSFSLQQTGKDKQTVNVFASKAAYEDHTSSVFNVEAGSELTASFNYSGQWMNGYIYIDRDNDGEFSYKEGQWDQAGTDLVAYSFYTTLANPKVNDGNGYNSTGASVSGNDRSNVNPPVFTAPTEPGTYRIRFKIDWNCILPGGSSDILSDGGGVWDATLNVVAAKPEVKEEKNFTDAISMVVGDMSEEVGQAQVTIKEMTDETISMTLAVVGQEGAEYTASGFTKAVDTEKNRTTYTGSLNVDGDDFDVTALVYTEGTVEKLYMVAKGAEYNYVVGTNPDAATVVSDKTYTSNLMIMDGEEPVVDEAEAQVNVIKYSDETYKITLKDVSLLNQTSDLVFVGKALVDETAAADEPLTIMAKSDGATTNFFGEEMNASFELTEVSADEVKMEFAIESENFSYMGQFNYEEEKPEPEVYTSNLHIYDAAAPETDLFKADKANVEFLATETGEFTLTLKDVTLNEKTQDLVFTGAFPTPQPGGQEPLAEEGEGEVTPDEPAMVLNATADEATATFLGAASATAEFSISYNAADEFMMTFTMKAGEKNYGGEFNYEAKTPAAEPFCKENYVADGNGFEWEIPVDWDTQKVVMSIDPSTCTGSCEHIIGLGASPTTFHGNLQLYRTSADQMLQGYFENDGGNHNTGKFAETAPFLVEVSKAKGFVVNDEVKITASEMSELFTLSTVKMGTGEGVNDKSRATYNYVKVVDKDWTKDPETGINATTVAEGEFEVFSVDGVKLSKLQKGLNIVRSADGKVKKVLVK
uniref:calycin-like domain-containing protein n=1 Tax=Prevotella sp. TaxID=59823 RepID=UPI00402831E7